MSHWIRADTKQESSKSKSSLPELFLGKGVLKKFSKSTGEHRCQSVVAALLKSHFWMDLLL